jgi:Fe-S cluster assembly iron-binding protein IscA
VLKDTPSQVLRVRVDPGGCSGFQYVFSIEDAPQNDDMCAAVSCSRASMLCSRDTCTLP